MLNLVSTSDKLQIVSSASGTVDVHASYVDWNGTVSTPDRKNTPITTATTTDVVPAPGSSVQRNVKALHIRNKHATTAMAVTIQHTDGTTVVELFKTTLGPGDSLLYNEYIGFVNFGV